MPVGEMKKCVHRQRSKRPRRCELRGLFYPSWRGGSVLRLTTSCYFPSSHLQMQQAITLAIMESINEESISINNAPPFCSCLGVVALPLYHIGKVQSLRCTPVLNGLSVGDCVLDGIFLFFVMIPPSNFIYLFALFFQCEHSEIL